MTGPQATERLRERQLAHPPWRGSDRGQQIVRLIGPDLLPEIGRRLVDGTLAVGEVGLADLCAHAERLEDGSFVVEINSGLMQFLYLIIRTLQGSSYHRGTQGVVAPVLTYEQLTHRVAQIFLDWQAGKYATEAGFQEIELPIHRRQLRSAQEQTLNAEIFVIAHELGHVVMDGGDGDKHPAPRQWSGDETYADWLGVRMALAMVSHLGLQRMRYAGVLLAVRVFCLLERLGQKFLGPHPPPAERLGLVKQMAHTLFLHEIEFTAASTIALTYDEAMESVENELLKRSRKTEQTVERVRVRLWAMLEERVKDNLSHEDFITVTQQLLPETDEATCKEVSQVLHEWFALPRANSIPDPTGGRLPLMGGLLRAAIPDFPEPARAIFAAAFG